MINAHTYTVGGVDLILAAILVTHRELLQLACHVISSARVDILVGVDSV
jgi:hypothetical protein